MTTKPRLLLHICCAPDEAWVVHTLAQEYELRCFFCNPNIAPLDEYELRLTEARSVARQYSVAFDAAEYTPTQWEDAVLPHRHTPEGGERCVHCFKIRLHKTAQFCATIGWTDFTTVMSISPHKNLAQLQCAGDEAAALYKVRFVPFDFKKDNGFVKSIVLSKELGLYRQNYCGCSLSRDERDIRKAKRMAEKKSG